MELSETIERKAQFHSLKDHSIKETLINLGISSESSFEPYQSPIRDRSDLTAYRCNKSGVFILNSIDHAEVQPDNLDYWSKNEGSEHFTEDGDNYLPDDFIRAKQHLARITDRDWVDFGCGLGGCLRLIGSKAKSACGIEIQEAPREYLKKKGLQSFKTIDDLNDHSVDIVTLFHVLEHMSQPIEILKSIRPKLRKNGTIFIEIPHANDALHVHYASPEYRKFIFWSDHLIWHTKESIRAFLEESGYSNIQIEGMQRYPMENHLYWLTNKKPGGHEKWKELGSQDLHREYEKRLQALNLTDTLTVIANP